MTEPEQLPIPGCSADRFYPLDCLVAAIGADQADAIAAELRKAGFSEHAGRVVPSADVVAKHDEFLANRSIAERFDAKPADDARACEDEYLAAARRGDAIVIARVPNGELRDRIRKTLADHGGHAMRFYQRAGIQDV